MTTQVSPRPALSPLGARFVARLTALPRTLVRGRAGSARWERPALLGLLLATAVLYLWDLGASGWANSFYSAAVQAGSVDWTAFFYGSSDAANAITVDKPPASLWLMALSVRLFGLSSWSILVPEALMGVASVGVLFATVRRRFSAGTALLAGATLAVTPVAALMFRFNNPDALLVLLLSLATYFTLRGIETGRLKWVLWAGAMVGFGFLTKQLQAFLILPPLAGVYLYAAPHRFRTRLWHSFAALGAVIVSAGWWVAIVELVPTSWRPYIGGSQTNSFLELTFGYNGFGRLTGSETGSVTGGAGGTGAVATGGMWGETGIFRLFLGEFGGQITWLLPAALLLVVAALVVLRRAPRISLRRATLLLFAGYLILTALAFSFMAGIFHAYYTVALAPALAGTFAIGASLVWMKRTALWARITAAVAMLATSAWAWVLLDRAADWLPWLKFVVVAFGLVAAALLMVPPRVAWLGRLSGKWGRRTTVAIALTGALLAPVAYTIDTVSTAHTGSIVTAGPAVSGGMGGMGGGGMPGGRAGFPGGNAGGFAGGGTPPAGGTVRNGAVPNGAVPNGTVPNGTTGTLRTGGRPGGGTGGPAGLMGSASVSDSLAALLSVDSGSYTWIAAAVGSDSAAGYQLATQLPVMAIGGFNGSDPAPTLAEFQADVAAGKIHYFIGGRTGQANGGSSASSEIAAWVAENFTAQTVDSVTLYDLSAGTTAAASASASS